MPPPLPRDPNPSETTAKRKTIQNVYILKDLMDSLQTPDLVEYNIARKADANALISMKCALRG